LAALGLHARAESVLLAPLAPVGLERTLRHEKYLLLIRFNSLRANSKYKSGADFVPYPLLPQYHGNACNPEMHTKKGGIFPVVMVPDCSGNRTRVTLASMPGKIGTLLRGRASNRTVWPVIL
jgi:hypothetical protein